MLALFHPSGAPAFSDQDRNLIVKLNKTPFRTDFSEVNIDPRPTVNYNKNNNNNNYKNNDDKDDNDNENNCEKDNDSNINGIYTSNNINNNNINNNNINNNNINNNINNNLNNINNNNNNNNNLNNINNSNCNVKSSSSADYKCTDDGVWSLKDEKCRYVTVDGNVVVALNDGSFKVSMYFWALKN